MPTKLPKIFYEDIVIDRVVPLGTTAVTTADIKSYARTFDPQPLHLDEEAAKHTMIGRLCASGWHSCAILMRLLCDGFLLDASSLGSPGMKAVKFLKPVFPDEPLSGRLTCTAKRVLQSRPQVGACEVLIELLNAKGEPLVTWETTQFMKLRTAVAAANPAAANRAETAR
jgi:acyl dehydratase